MSERAQRAAWLRLTLVPGVGPAQQRALLSAFGLPTQIFDAGRASLAAVVGGESADRLLTHDNTAQVEAALTWCDVPGNQLLTLADAGYPAKLLELSDPPTVLYLRGNAALLARPMLAMVGARNATAQGLANARAFAAELTRAGLVIVSGLALGIDAAAHAGALDAAGGTVAVIGTGADRVYPARNAELARRIAEHGLIVSEFPLGTQALAHNFPRRNRIISGLAGGVLVVEAALDSGSLITARLAGEQGREVFAIPGSIHSPLARGCHSLLKQGAKLVESAADILEELRLPGTSGGPERSEATLDPLSEPAHQLLAALGHDPADSDTLLARTRLTPDTLFAILTELELEGRLERLPGGRYQRVS